MYISTMAKTFKKADYQAEDLLQAGIDHIYAAEILLKDDPFYFDSAGYLAHMGLELMLKSWLLYEKGQFDGIHSLEKLTNEIVEHDSRVSFSKKEKQTLKYLSRFEELRYPNRKNPIEIGAEDVEQIHELADAFWQQLPDELITSFESLDNSDKVKKGGRVLMERPSHIPRILKFETGIEE